LKNILCFINENLFVCESYLINNFKFLLICIYPEILSLQIYNKCMVVFLGHLRPERPAHLHPEMLHPALREKGRAIPQRPITVASATGMDGTASAPRVSFEFILVQNQFKYN